MISGCGKNVNSHNLCAAHDKRRLLYGDPNFRINAPNGTGTIKKGYRIISKNGRRAGEHVWIMEAFLGRKLKKGEDVHHKNDKRMDNRIENLCLMSHSDHLKLTVYQRAFRITNEKIIKFQNRRDELIGKLSDLRRKYQIES